MILFWKIRYLDRTDKEFKDRNLFLDTDTLDPATKAAVELVAESSKSEREILKYRHLFEEDNSESRHQRLAGGCTTIFLIHYHEDEEGNEIPFSELGKALTGDRNSVVIPPGAEQHDIDYILAEKKPVPVAEVTLSDVDLKVLGYFTRDLQELSESAFQKNGAGTINSKGSLTPGNLVLQTSVTDDEIRSFVTIFRRLYMEKEPANFRKALNVFTGAIGDHPLANWVAATGERHEEQLTSTVDLWPFVQSGQCSFARKRVIDVFLYTQYSHQPDEKRQRQYTECLKEVNDDKDLLTFMFLTELWKTSIQIENAGRRIAGWFNRYCQEHQVDVDVLKSVRIDSPGIGSQETSQARRARLFGEKSEALATEMWKQNGRPKDGPKQFLEEAKARISKALDG